MEVYDEVHRVKLFGDICEKAENEVPKDAIVKAIDSLGNTYFEAEHIEIINNNNAFIPLSCIKKLRRDVLSKFKDVYTGKRKTYEHYEIQEKVSNKYIDKKREILISVDNLIQARSVTSYKFDYLLLNIASLTIEDVDRIIEEDDHKKIIELPVIFRNEHLGLIDKYSFWTDF